MLRGKTVLTPVVLPDDSSWPDTEAGFGFAERALGIRFYRAKESFFRPYALLRGLHLAEERLAFTFANDEVLVQGRSLHALYVAAAEQRLAWLCAQGELGAAGNGPVGISHIDLVPLRDNAPAAD